MAKFAVVVGGCIGDALGAPWETKSPLNPTLIAWDGLFKDGGTFWKGNAGNYTDDGKMLCCISRSLIRSHGFDPSDAAAEYLAWYKTLETRGIGSTTATAMENLKLGYSWETSGLVGDKFGGNGTAMRVAPIGIVYRNDMVKLLEVAQLDAQITHNSLEPKVGSMAVALGTALLSHQNMMPEDVLDAVIEVVPSSVVKNKLIAAKYHLENDTDPKAALLDIGTSGYVPETVGAAFYCLCRNDNFNDIVIMAVRGGKDADTTSAVAGAMAGAFYGLDGIDRYYKDNVEDFDILAKLDEELTNIEI